MRTSRSTQRGKHLNVRGSTKRKKQPQQLDMNLLIIDCCGALSNVLMSQISSPTLADSPPIGASSKQPTLGGVCSTCKTRKPIEDFPIHHGTLRRKQCRDCYVA